MSSTLATPLTTLLGIKYPVLLAGMNNVAGTWHPRWEPCLRRQLLPQCGGPLRRAPLTLPATRDSGPELAAAVTNCGAHRASPAGGGGGLIGAWQGGWG